MIYEQRNTGNNYITYSNCWSPTLLFVQNAKTDRTRGVYVRMEEWWDELTLGWLRWIFFTKFKCYLVHTAFPIGTLLPGDARFPKHDIRWTITPRDWTCMKSKWMISSPCFAFLYLFIYYSTFINDRQRWMSVVRYWYQILIIYYKNKSYQ